MTPFEQSTDDSSVSQSPPPGDQPTGQPVDRTGKPSADALSESTAPSARTEPPLLRFDNVRVDTDGRIVCAGLQFEAYDCPIAICGPGGKALVHGLAGDAFGGSKIMQGHMFVGGLDVGKKEHFSKVAIALANPALPRTVSVKEYLRMHGIASGLSRSKANDNARAALYDLGLRKLENMLVDALSTEQRRCATLAAALVTTRPIVVAQTPVDGLDWLQAKFVLPVLGQLARRAKVIVTAHHVDASSPEYQLVMGARDVVMTDHQTVLWQGTPQELTKMSRAVSLWVQGNVTAFEQMLSQRGFGLWQKVGSIGQSIRQSDQANAFIAVRVPEGKTSQHLLQIAHDCQIAVLQMLPLLPGSFEIPAETQQTTKQPSQCVNPARSSLTQPATCDGGSACSDAPVRPANQTSTIDPVNPVNPGAPIFTDVAIPEPGSENGAKTDVPASSTHRL